MKRNAAEKDHVVFFFLSEFLCSQGEPGQRLRGSAGVHHAGPRRSRLILWVQTIQQHSQQCFPSQTDGVCLVSSHTFCCFCSGFQCISRRWSSLSASRWPAIESTCTQPSTQRYGELTGIILRFHLTEKPVCDTWGSPFSCLGHQGRSTRFSTHGWPWTWWWRCWWGWPGSSSPPDRKQTILRVRGNNLCWMLQEISP